MIHNKILIAFVIILFSCVKSDKKIFYIKFDKIKNLKAASEVYSNGIAVGKVSSLKILSNYQILVEVEVDQSVQAKKTDEFGLSTYDFLGSQVVEIISGIYSPDFYKSGDTIRGVIFDKEPLLKLDSLERKVGIDSLLTPHIRN